MCPEQQVSASPFKPDAQAKFCCQEFFARASGFELRRLFHQPELPADVGLNVIGGQAAVGLDDQFFPAEEF